MNLRKRQSGQLMLIVLGTLFLGGGAATGVFVSGKTIDSIRRDVKALRLDTHRQEEVFALLDRWATIADSTSDDLPEYASALMDLVRQHDATHADFQEALERQRVAFREAEGELLPLRDQLRATLSREEWNRLFQ